MKITIAFTDSGDQSEMPTLLSAYDEYTAEAWNGVPDFHLDIVEHEQSGGGTVRECTIEVPDRFVRGLFEVPELPVSDWRSA